MTSELNLTDEIEAPEEPLLRWRRIQIEGLFRRFNHDIELRADERVTIIHGRNGVGKTVTLQMVDALARGDYRVLQRIPFGLLRVEFSGGVWVEVRQPLGSGRPRGGKLDARTSGTTEWSELDPRHDTSQDALKRAFGAEGVELYDPVKEVWVDTSTKQLLTTPVVVARYFHGNDPRHFVGQGDPLFFLRRRSRTHLIEAQRLLHLDPAAPSAPGRPPRQTVVALAQDLARRIAAADEQYTQISLTLDGSLPQRLFAKGKPKLLSDEELRARTEALERERGRLQELGLLKSDARFDPSGLDEAKRAMFAVYLEDNEKKLGVFRDLADRAELLLEAMNRKLAPTVLKVSKRHGYQAFAHDGQELALNLLSSGEQQELVLLHRLLFNVQPGSLVLIDEPELSLHVTWQQEFLDDLLPIARKAEFDALVATHSPYIVGKHRELMVELGDLS